MPLVDVGRDERPISPCCCCRRGGEHERSARRSCCWARGPRGGAADLRGACRTRRSTGRAAGCRRSRGLSLYDDLGLDACAICLPAGRPILALCAAGIVIRLLAPLLADKRAEPPVVAVAEDGSVAVPLLGGHRGANRLARRIAAGARRPAAITTAGDVRFDLALDDPPPGWRVRNPEAAKTIVSALLEGAHGRPDGRGRRGRLADRRRRAVRRRRRAGSARDRSRRSGSATRLVIHPQAAGARRRLRARHRAREVLELVSDDARRARPRAGRDRLRRLDRAEGGRAGDPCARRAARRARCGSSRRPSWRRRRRGSPTRRTWCSRRPAATASPRARRWPRSGRTASWWSRRPSRSARPARLPARPRRSIRPGSAGRRGGLR